jgi:hypothetical protein
MTFSILICLAAFAVLVRHLRSGPWPSSLGLPIAYLFGLLLIHVPGAIAHSLPGSHLPYAEITARGIFLTMIGSICFVTGVWVSRCNVEGPLTIQTASRRQFWLFCLIAGWLVVYGLSPLTKIPSLGAAIEKGAAVWMLGVLLGLRGTLGCEPLRAALWMAALLVYPTVMLLLGGFLSYGSTAIIVCLAPLVVSTRSHWRAAAGLLLIAVVGVHVFLSYFQNRNEIRYAVWGGTDLESRVSATTKIFKELKVFDPNDEAQLRALDLRLNQNYFAGLSAANLDAGHVDYLWGRSVWEGILALVPRIIWPDKPVYGGSPMIVSEMTGLELDEGTSWGVGQVMEFHINFGVPGIVIGFLLLGWSLGRLDLMAAVAERAGDAPRLFRSFLPAVALIQPNGSIIELVGGAAAAWVAAFGWGLAWNYWAAKWGCLHKYEARFPFDQAAEIGRKGWRH